MDMITRQEWSARPPNGNYSTLRTTLGTKVHYTGSRENPAMLDNHSLCYDRVRAIQRSHMDGNGWMDIGYTMLVCPHRGVFSGRGPGYLPAANGAGLNASHYAVCALVGSAGLVMPNNDTLLGVLDAIDYLRTHGGAGSQIKGHRDGYSTACPGDLLYTWIQAGCPSPEDPLALPPPEPVQPWPGRYLSYESGSGMMRGEDVLLWQTRMSERGWTIAKDGWYGSQSRDVAREFQKAKALIVDGVVGPKTWDAAWSAPVV